MEETLGNCLTGESDEISDGGLSDEGLPDLDIPMDDSMMDEISVVMTWRT